MKKYILLIGVLCLSTLPTIAGNDGKLAVLQDSTKQSKKDSAVKKDKIFNFEGFDEFPDLESLNEDILKEASKMADELSSLSNDFSTLGSSFNFSYESKEKKEKVPTRVEKKNYSNISEIEIDHKYGDIVIRESSTKQVELEIQYFDNKNAKATCDITTSKNILFLTTTFTRNNTKINYIINIPRNTGLTVILKYGNIKLDEHRGTFDANLSYSNLNAQSFSNTTPSIRMKYGNLNIGSAQNILLTASYSKVKIEKANQVNLSGKYTDYVIDNIGTIDTGDSYSYGNFKIGTITTMKANVKYADINIENLLSDFILNSSYGNVNIKTETGKFNNITIDGSYTDITVTMPENSSTAFDVDLKYGDLNISKKHTKVSYSQQEEKNNNVKKTGIMGNSKTSTSQIKISNKFADVRIR